MDETAVRLLTQCLAMTGAMRQAMTVLIASHPDPAAALAAWDSRNLQWVDAEMQQDYFQLPEYQEAYVQTLQGLATEIRAAAHRRNGESPTA